MWEYGESKGNRIIFSLELKNLIKQQPGSGSQPSQKRPFMSCGEGAGLLLRLPNQIYSSYRRLLLLSSLPRGAGQGPGSKRLKTSERSSSCPTTARRTPTGQGGAGVLPGTEGLE